MIKVQFLSRHWPGLTIGLLAAVSGVWLLYDSGTNITDPDFKQSAGIAFLAIAVGTGILDALFSAIERRRSRSARFAAYLDSQYVALHLRILINQATRQRSWCDVRPLEGDGAGDVEFSVYTGRDAPTHPKSNVRTYFAFLAKKVEVQIDKSLSRHSNFMSPELISALSAIEHTTAWLMFRDVLVASGFEVVKFRKSQIVDLESAMNILERCLVLDGSAFRAMLGFVDVSTQRST